METISGISYTATVREEKTVSYEDAAELMAHFEEKGYITRSGKVKDTMKNALLNGTLDLPKKFESARERFETIINRADKAPPLRDASKDVVVRLKKQVLLSPEFIELWDKIKQKTVYRVKVDSKELVRRCVKDLRETPPIPRTRIVSQTADIYIENAGVTHVEREIRTTDIRENLSALPNILTIVGEQTLVKRTTVFEIIEKSGRGADFIRNPQLFMETLIEIIQNNCYALDIDGIRYIKLDGEEYYVQEIFEASELMANLDKNAVAVSRSVYDYVIYDSDTVERPFAVALDNDPEVKMFFKLPDRFKIETPIGSYNPDWAVYLDRDGVQKMYFILETKGSSNLFDLRTPERLKIHCGTEHFKALENGVELRTASDWKSIKEKI